MTWLERLNAWLRRVIPPARYVVGYDHQDRCFVVMCEQSGEFVAHCTTEGEAVDLARAMTRREQET